MKKSLIVLVTMLLMILSTGCKSQPVVASTLPATALIAETEKLTDVEETTKQNTTIATTELVTTEVLSTEVESSEIEISTYHSELDVSESLPIVETITVEVTTETSTTVLASTISTTAVPTTTSTTAAETVPPSPKYTYTELDKYMYCQGDTNVRTEPSLDGSIVVTFSLNRRVYVSGRCNETGWYRINIEGQTFYISDVMLGDKEYVAPTTQEPQVVRTSVNTTRSSDGFVYYVSAYMTPSYDLELYLYNQLHEVGIGWYYKYAVAQIAQESCWNPNSTNGRDHGLCQFKGIYWAERCAAAGLPGADIWNPYHQIYVYVRFIKDLLVRANHDVHYALSMYITGNPDDWHQFYIDCVMGRFNSLISK